MFRKQSQLVAYNDEALEKWKKRLKEIDEQVRALRLIGGWDFAIIQLNSEAYVIKEHLIKERLTFIHELEKDPAFLFQEKSQKIMKRFKEFDEANPLQSFSQRKLLWCVKEKIAIIEAVKIETRRNYEALFQLENEKAAWRKRYLILAGWLQEAYVSLQNEVGEQADRLKHLIHSLLLEMHLGLDSDLPTPFLTGNTSISHYHAVKCTNDLFTLDDQAFLKAEADKFDLELSTLKTVSSKQDDLLHQTAGSLAKKVEKEMKHHKEQKRAETYCKLYTSVLVNARTILSTPPLDLQRQEVLQQGHILVNALPKAPKFDVWRHVVTLVGVALVVGGILTIPSSFGLSLFGISIGTSLLAKFTAFGLLGTGSGMLWYRPKKTVTASQKLTDFMDAAANQTKATQPTLPFFKAEPEEEKASPPQSALLYPDLNGFYP